jgi:hypothetical protein
LQLAPPNTDGNSNSTALSPDKDQLITVTLPESDASQARCGDFSILRKPVTAVFVPNVVYRADTNTTLNVRALSWPQENQIYFVLQSSDQCDVSEAQSSLIRLAIEDENTTVVTEQIDDFSNDPYAFSPDSRFVAWIGFDPRLASSYLAITDLQDNVKGKLISLTHVEALMSPNSSKRFTSVHWIP